MADEQFAELRSHAKVILNREKHITNLDCSTSKDTSERLASETHRLKSHFVSYVIDFVILFAFSRAKSHGEKVRYRA